MSNDNGFWVEGYVKQVDKLQAERDRAVKDLERNRATFHDLYEDLMKERDAWRARALAAEGANQARRSDRDLAEL